MKRSDLIKTKLLSWIQSNAPALSDGLPSQSVLAHTFGTSINSVNRAVRELAGEGHLHTVRGKGSFLGPELLPQSIPVPKAKPDPLVELRRNLREGRWNTGMALPPLKTLCHLAECGRSRMLAVLRQLEKEHLIFKKGRIRFAGPAPETRRKSPSIVNILVPNKLLMDLMFQDFGAGPFLQSLVQELERFYVVPRFVREETFLQTGPSGNSLSILGFLLPFVANRYRHPEMVADLLGRKNTPIVFLDRSGSRRPWPGLPKSSLSFHPDEAAACHVLLHMLVQEGHRKIAYAWTGEANDWKADRARLLKEVAARSFPSLELNIFNRPSPIGTDREAAVLENLARSGQPYLSPILRISPSLDWNPIGTGNRVALTAHFTLEEVLAWKPTALVCPNDTHAVAAMRWKELLQRHGAADIALFGFDNSVQSLTDGFSSVDFGFSRMGHLAARYFLGFGKAGNPRKRSITVQPEVILRL